MQEPPDILISVDESLPASWAQECADSVAAPSLDMIIDRPKPGGLQAGPELLLATAAFLFLFKSYFDGFLKEAGKDHYQALKAAISKFWPRFFGKDRLVTTTVIVSPPGKLTPGPRYSSTFSLMAESTRRRRFKLLIPDNASFEEFEASTEAFLQFMQAQHSGQDLDTSTRALVESPDTYGLVLVTYDPATKSLHGIDFMTGAPRLPSAGESE